MKAPVMQIPLALLGLILSAGISLAAPPVVNTSFSGPTAPVAVPDNQLSGLAYSFAFNDPGLTSIRDVSLTLNLSGGWNGDLFAYLSHGTGLAVLLNRVGRTSANLAGSPDSGMNITFSDSGANGDIHLGSAGGGVLSGSWQPDGRNVDPATALDTSPRTSSLSSFSGLNPNGQWTLFVADTSPLSVSTLDHYSVTISAVPEPTVTALESLGAVLLILGSLRKDLNRRAPRRQD